MLNLVDCRQSTYYRISVRLVQMRGRNSMDQPLVHKSLSQFIADQLRRGIWNRDIQFGERLLESELAERFEVSRSSVREALMILEHEGLVKSKTRKGTYVTEFSAEDRQEILELRTLLETYAFKRALPRLEEKHIEDLEKILERMKVKTTEKNWSDLFDLDMQFHHYIVKVCGNSRLISIYNSIHVQIRTFLAHLDQYYSSYELFYEEHRELLDALLTRDSNIIDKAVRQHIEYVEEQLLNL